MKAVNDPVEFFADRIRAAFRDPDPNDHQLIRLCVARAEVILHYITVHILILYLFAQNEENALQGGYHFISPITSYVAILLKFDAFTVKSANNGIFKKRKTIHIKTFS